MNNPPLTREKTLQIFKNGIYYCPASKHYSSNESINIVCDRCKRTNIDICIGYETYDLCLQCIQEINQQLKRQKEMEEVKTFMVQSQFRPQTMTNMQQAQFRPQTKTYMQQAQFRTQFRDDDSDEESATLMMQSLFR